MTAITYEVVRELLDYDPETGIFTWRNRDRRWFSSKRGWMTWNARYEGKRAGTVWTSPDGGYQRREMTLNYQRIKEHRAAWMWMKGAPAPTQLDHINRDATDNRWANLRASSNAENCRNLSKRRNNTSGVTGVSWSKVAGKWAARCRGDSRYQSLGYFDDISEAAAAVQEFRARHGFDPAHGAEPAHYHA